MIARDKACEHPDKACHGESCPLAQGFYDRLPAARQAASELSLLNQAALRQVALEHGVCPYYLSQEMARWADVVVADYNYYFDFSALLFGLAQANTWKVAVLVDEAHNLVERGRQMYSAILDQSTLDGVTKNRPRGVEKTAAASQPRMERLASTSSLLLIRPTTSHRKNCSRPCHRAAPASAITSTIIRRDSTAHCKAFYFEVLQFCRVAELFDQQYLFDISKRDLDRKRNLSQLCLRNVVPAGFIGPRLSAARSTVLFSATLSPRHYYADLLGTPANTVCIDVESPFHADQLHVQIINQISTRFVHRQASLAPIVELIARQFMRRPGNYLAFFSSFDYLQQVAQLLAERYPGINLWSQSRGMAEGATPGVPRPVHRRRPRRWLCGVGRGVWRRHRFAGCTLDWRVHRHPGVGAAQPGQRATQAAHGGHVRCGLRLHLPVSGVHAVVQAAGRVIRTQQDQGVVMLIDDRFGDNKVRQLLPRWWSIASAAVQMDGLSHTAELQHPM